MADIEEQYSLSDEELGEDLSGSESGLSGSESGISGSESGLSGSESEEEIEFIEATPKKSVTKVLPATKPKTSTKLVAPTKVPPAKPKTPTKVTKPEIKVPAAKPKTPTKVTKPETKTPTKVTKPETKVSTKVTKPETKVSSKVTKPETKTPTKVTKSAGVKVPTIKIKKTEAPKRELSDDMINKLREELPNIMVRSVSELPEFEGQVDIEDLLRKEVDESIDDFEARRRLTLVLVNSDMELNNMAAFVLAHMIMKKARLGLTYNRPIEEAIVAVEEALLG